MRSAGRRLTALALALAVSPVAAGSVARAESATEMSLARFTDSATATKTVTTDTLDPPTSLSATGGASVSLSWTATPDTYATGTEVWRGTVSGGLYSLITTVTPRTTVTTTDSPGFGTFFYVLRSAFQNWRSVNSNQVSATVSTPTSTGYHGCTAASNAADTGGNGNGYETNPTLACASGGGNAVDANSGTNSTLSCTDAGKDRHRWWDFGLGVPGTVSSVAGIQVRTDLGQSNNGGTTWVCIQLSWNGGTSWTTPESAVVSGTAITTYNLGGATDTWGRTWVGSDFSSANFRVRVIDATTQGNKDFRLDYLAVQVSYYP